MAASGRDLTVSRAVVRLIATGIRVTRELSEALAPVGLSTQQFVVLMELASSEAGVRPLSELMERAQSSAPNMSGLVSRMERAGLVRKRRDGEDQRVLSVEITDAGWTRLAEGAPLLIAAEKELVGGLSRSELAELARLIARL
jgi:DNA-binding MarR family transcriptional regulator